MVENNTGESCGIVCDVGYFKFGIWTERWSLRRRASLRQHVFVNQDEFWEYFPKSEVAETPDVRTRMMDPSIEFQRFWERVVEPYSPRDTYKSEEPWPQYVQKSGSRDS